MFSDNEDESSGVGFEDYNDGRDFDDSDDSDDSDDTDDIPDFTMTDEPDNDAETRESEDE